MWQGFQWNRWSRSGGKSLHNFGAQSGQNSHLIRKNFLGKFHLRHFYLLIVLYHVGKFEKIVGVDSKIKVCIILDHNRAKIAHFAHTSSFGNFHLSDVYQPILGFPPKWCLSTYCLYHAVKFEKNSFVIYCDTGLHSFGSQLRTN